MIKIYRYEDLGSANHGWLNAKHHFSFASYYNPDRMGFGKLRVINDDIIKAGRGFDTHSHRDMEIITYVKSGAITHKDSNGNEGRTEAGDIQVMSAGTGIFHSEYNLESKDTNIYQIWIEPNKTGVKPRWEAKEFPKNHVVDGQLSLLVSGNKGDDNALFIHQDAKIYGGKIKKDVVINQPIEKQAYLLVANGRVGIGDDVINRGDGVEMVNIKNIKIKALEDSDILVIDVPKE